MDMCEDTQQLNTEQQNYANTDGFGLFFHGAFHNGIFSGVK